MASKKELIDAYVDWLGGWSWDWFAVLTHRGYPSRSTVDKKFACWISLLKKEAGSSTFRFVMIIETGACHDNVHVHALIGGLRPVARHFPTPWKARWEKMAGEAMIKHFDPKRGGLAYLLKTLLPGRDFELKLELQERTRKGN